jgi:DNA invertase Pin-like site-specific DNA recombinase
VIKEERHMLVGYARVSTIEQNEERQIRSLLDQGVEEENIFIDKMSGKNVNRPKFQEMMHFVRRGDTLIVSEFSRLSRSTKDLLYTMETLNKKGVKVISLKENLDTDTPQGKLMLTLFAALAEFERELILERQREGIAIAKEKGKYKGRAPMKFDTQLLNKVLSGVQDKTITISEAARLLNVTRPTVYNILKRNGVYVEGE